MTEEQIKAIQARVDAGERPTLTWENTRIGIYEQARICIDTHYWTTLDYSGVSPNCDGETYSCYCISGKFPSMDAAKLAYEDTLADSMGRFVLGQSMRFKAECQSIRSKGDDLPF